MISSRLPSPGYFTNRLAHSCKAQGTKMQGKASAFPISGRPEGRTYVSSTAKILQPSRWSQGLGLRLTHPAGEIFLPTARCNFCFEKGSGFSNNNLNLLIKQLSSKIHEIFRSVLP